MNCPVVKLLVCGMCVQENRPPAKRFRASDSVRGERSVLEHMLSDHSAAMVNAFIQSWENR